MRGKETDKNLCSLFIKDCPLDGVSQHELLKDIMDMKRVFLVWLLLVSAIILVDLSTANPTNNNNNVKNKNNVATASVTVSPNGKFVTNPVRGTVGGMQLGNKNRRPIIFGTISRDEWLAKEYFGYLCGKHL